MGGKKKLTLAERNKLFDQLKSYNVQSLTLFLPVYTKQTATLEDCLRLFREHNRAVLASNEMGLHLARADFRRRPL